MRQEIDVRYIVTSLDVNGALRHDRDAERLYEGVDCQRGEAENLIKLHVVPRTQSVTLSWRPIAPRAHRPQPIRSARCL